MNVQQQNGDRLTPLERLGRNDALFREANERMRAQAGGHDSSSARPTEYLCECRADACLELVELTPDEYDAIRLRPAAFVVAPGHEHGDGRRVLERTERFVLVERPDYHPDDA